MKLFSSDTQCDHCLDEGVYWTGEEMVECDFCDAVEYLDTFFIIDGTNLNLDWEGKEEKNDSDINLSR